MMKSEGWRFKCGMDGLEIKRTFPQEVNGGQLKEANRHNPNFNPILAEK
jgi:hypothetical protein